MILNKPLKPLVTILQAEKESGLSKQRKKFQAVSLLATSLITIELMLKYHHLKIGKATLQDAYEIINQDT